MKRRLAWLALPIVLFAVTWGVKWRADHPAPTKEDLGFRALLMGSSRVEVALVPYSPPLPYTPNPRAYHAHLLKKDLKAFSNTLYVLRGNLGQISQAALGAHGSVRFHCYFSKGRLDGLSSIEIQISVDNSNSRMMVYHEAVGGGYGEELYDLHPATKRRWFELLLINPRFGAELRKQMNNP